MGPAGKDIRWYSFGTALLGASVAGTGYAFGIFSEVMKDRLGYSQLDLSIVGSVGNTGLYAQIFGGLGIQYFGTKKVLILSACLIMFGNMYMWLAVQKAVPHTVTVMSFMNFCAQLGIGFTTCTCTTIAIRIFPSSVRGQVSGLVKSYYGLSSAVLATIASGYFNGHSKDFILFVAIALPVIELFTAFNAQLIPDKDVPLHGCSIRNIQTVLLPFHGHLAGMFACVIVIGALHEYAGISRVVDAVTASSFSIYLLLVMVLYVVFYKNDNLVRNSAESHQGNVLREDVNGSETATHKGEEAVKQEAGEDEHIPEEYADVCFYGEPKELSFTLKTWRCYAIMAVFCTVCGCGLLVINNIQAVAEAVKRSPSPFFVTLLSVANAGGRIGVGVAADYLKEKGVSRLQLLTCTCLLMAVALFSLSFGDPVLFYICIIITGFSFGAVFSNMVALTADLYGSKYFSANYGWFTMSPAFGAYIFAVGFIALFYPGGSSSSDDGDDDDNNNNDEDDDDSACEGAHCFRIAFLLCSLCCVLASVLSHILHVTTPLLDIEKKRSISKEDAEEKGRDASIVMMIDTNSSPMTTTTSENTSSA